MRQSDQVNVYTIVVMQVLSGEAGPGLASSKLTHATNRALRTAVSL